MNYTNLYVKFLKRFFRVKSPVKVVFDCSNGTVGPVLAKLLKEQRLIKFKIINRKPDGNFPAHSPNPLTKGAVKQLIGEVRKTKSDLGIIFDGDGDRVLFIDNLGREIDPRYILCLLAPLFSMPYLVNTALGKEVMKWLLPKSKFIEEKTGRYFIKRTAQKKNIDFAVERSGHYFFKDFHYADSGILTAILAINQVSLLKSKGLNLSEWINALPQIYSTGEVNLKAKNVKRFLTLLQNRFRGKGYKVYKNDGVTIVGPDSWINARASNTEPVIRVQLVSRNRQAFMVNKKILETITSYTY